MQERRAFVGHQHVTWVVTSDANYQEQAIAHLAKCGATDLSWTLHLSSPPQRGRTGRDLRSKLKA
jgi:hypothetical protein